MLEPISQGQKALKTEISCLYSYLRASYHLSGITLTPLERDKGVPGDDPTFTFRTMGFISSLTSSLLRKTKTETTTEESSNPLTDQEVTYIKNAVGGEDAYSDLISWAAEALAPWEIKEYDELMDAGDAQLIHTRVLSLKAKYDQAVNSAPETVQELIRRQKNQQNQNEISAEADKVMQYISDIELGAKEHQEVIMLMLSKLRGFHESVIHNMIRDSDETDKIRAWINDSESLLVAMQNLNSVQL
jgi:hypothetical protein